MKKLRIGAEGKGSRGAALVAALALALACQSAQGAFYDGTNPMVGWFAEGVPYTGMMGHGSGTMDYAVYEPGEFGLWFPGEDPSGGDDYVYAYQITNTGADLIQCTVGLDGDEPLGSIGYLPGTGIEPTNSHFIDGPPPTSAGWNWDYMGSDTTAIVIFTSDAGPEPDKASFGTDPIDLTTIYDVPSPMPEPVCGLLLMGGAALVLRRRRASS